MDDVAAAKLPAIPAKRYFTIGEVSELCAVKSYVLRYWEQEFAQLRPVKRRGNRRYYQHHEVLLIRRIRDLLYDQGFTISGARNRLAGSGAQDGALPEDAEAAPAASAVLAAGGDTAVQRNMLARIPAGGTSQSVSVPSPSFSEPAEARQVRAELLSIRALLDI
jgi:DNA-binding transcriptional MerR regulator